MLYIFKIVSVLSFLKIILLIVPINFKKLGIPLIIIFARAASEPAHTTGAALYRKKDGSPLLTTTDPRSLHRWRPKTDSGIQYTDKILAVSPTRGLERKRIEGLIDRQP